MLPDTEPMVVTEAAATKVILVVEDDSANAELLMHVLLQRPPIRSIWLLMAKLPYNS
jgi:hypothetical protein